MADEATCHFTYSSSAGYEVRLQHSDDGTHWEDVPHPWVVEWKLSLRMRALRWWGRLRAWVRLIWERGWPAWWAGEMAWEDRRLWIGSGESKRFIRVMASVRTQDPQTYRALIKAGGVCVSGECGLCDRCRDEDR